MSKISFVMPALNRGAIIGETIQTIIAQTETDWELIVIDDHSEPGDKTAEVVALFNDKRIKYFRMPDSWPKGIASARNFGNQLAQSPIIAPSDSDDLNSPCRAKLILDSFKKEKWDVFYADYDYYYKESDEFKPRINPIKNFEKGLFKKFNFVTHSTSAYRREIALDFPYNSFFLVAEDYDFFSRLAEAGKKFYFCNEKVLHYVLHDKNISGGKKLKPVYDKLIALNRKWQKLDREEVIKDILDYYGKK